MNTYTFRFIADVRYPITLVDKTYRGTVRIRYPSKIRKLFRVDNFSRIAYLGYLEDAWFSRML